MYTDEKLCCCNHRAERKRKSEVKKNTNVYYNEFTDR